VLIARRTYLTRQAGQSATGWGNDTPGSDIDETYVNVNHSTARTWYDVEEGPWVQKPAGKGPRLIVVDASTSAGWVPGARLVFQARRRTGDIMGR